MRNQDRIIATIIFLMLVVLWLGFWCTASPEASWVACSAS